MADKKKFLDQSGVSILWSRIADKVAEEQARAEAAEAANAAAAKKAQDDVAALTTYVGTIPEGYTESNIVAYIKKVAADTLDAANGGSSESAASVKAALEAFIAYILNCANGLSTRIFSNINGLSLAVYSTVSSLGTGYHESSPVVDSIWKQ